ncbi:aromatic acid exporter family protein [Hamadaea tsunoensis]|uniref:hypothetical protein n=1 Tax=Hamadaea tsunoensis TaxID=53368 RepID=UPI0004061193|nr:hypothetical protein [Hamadaea tsunoensis]
MSASVPRVPTGDASRRGILPIVRDAWPVIRPIAWQILLAVVISSGLALLLGHTGFPVFAPLLAVATMELICARHHRRAVEMSFGVVIGALLTAVVGPSWSTPHVLIDAAIGTATAIGVAWFTTPRSPVRLVNTAIDPLLSELAGNIRAVSTALRRQDPPTAGAAVYSLVGTDAGLHRLDEVLLQVRRSAFLIKWSTGQDLTAYTRTAANIGDAVRNIRGVAEHAWWGILRAGEHVPSPLPQALDTLADGIGVLREELDRDGCLSNARPLLISSAQWISMMRSDHLSLGAAGVAASADAAVFNLLKATGMPAVEADAAQHARLVGV